MSNRLKFRVWDKENNCFLEDMNDWGMVFQSRETLNFEPLNMFLGDRYEIQQWTGLKDKNGREIYEGDILKFVNSDEESTIGEVVIGKYEDNEQYNEIYHHGYFLSEFNEFLGEKQKACTLPDCLSNGGIVIGNILENPELLS